MNKNLKLENTKGMFKFLFQWKFSKINIDENGNFKDLNMVMHQLASAANIFNETKTEYISSCGVLKDKIYFHYFYNPKNNNVFCLSNCWTKIENKYGKKVDVIHNGNEWKLTNFNKAKSRDYWVLAYCNKDKLKDIITYKNYAGATHAVFKYIGEFHKTKIEDPVKVNKNNFDIKKLVADTLKMSVHEIEFLYNSFDETKKTWSFYFKTINNKYLIRISDHWSASNSPRVLQVGNITSCWWELKSGIFNKPNNTGTFKVGIVKFKNMSKIKENLDASITTESKTKESINLVKETKILDINKFNLPTSLDQNRQIHANGLINKINNSILKFCNTFNTDVISIEIQNDENYIERIEKIYNKINILKNLLKDVNIPDVNNLLNDVTYMKTNNNENKENKLLKYVINN